jgi:hypothetical protein
MTMTKTRRFAVAIAALLAGSFVLPGLALAAPRTSAPVALFGGVLKPQDARSYANRTNKNINTAVRRIQTKASMTRMSTQQRTLLHNNTLNSANILRARLAKVTADGKVTAAESKEMRDLAVAVQWEMRKAHGNLDSFWML